LVTLSLAPSPAPLFLPRAFSHHWFSSFNISFFGHHAKISSEKRNALEMPQDKRHKKNHSCDVTHRLLRLPLSFHRTAEERHCPEEAPAHAFAQLQRTSDPD